MGLISDVRNLEARNLLPPVFFIPAEPITGFRICFRLSAGKALTYTSGTGRWINIGIDDPKEMTIGNEASYRLVITRHAGVNAFEPYLTRPPARYDARPGLQKQHI